MTPYTSESALYIYIYIYIYIIIKQTYLIRLLLIEKCRTIQWSFLWKIRPLYRQQLGARCFSNSFCTSRTYFIFRNVGNDLNIEANARTFETESALTSRNEWNKTRAFYWSELESYGTCGKSSERFRI